jgi:DNA-binding MurR/RpiR family transcriptional regulator
MREKIEGRAKTVEHRFVRRVLVPLGALAVILAVLSRIPLNAEKDLRSVLNSMKSDELAEIAVEDAERQSLYLVPSTESLAASLAEQTIDTKLAAAILSDDGATFDSMSDLSDQDVTVILKRLGERKIL